MESRQPFEGSEGSGGGAPLPEPPGSRREEPPGEREYQTIFNLVGVGLGQTDPATQRFVRVNRELCEITGYSEAELLERTFQDITHPDDRAQDHAAWARVIRGEAREWQNEKRYIRKDGGVRYVSVRGTVLRDEHGAPLRTIAVIHDITDRKRAVEALRRSEDRYRCLVEASAETVWSTSPEGWVKEIAPSCLALTGRAPAAMLGRGWVDVLHPDDRERMERQWEKAIETETRFESECRVRSMEGGYRLMLARAVPVRDEAGQVREWVGMNIDVTEKRQMEERFRVAQELSLDAFMVLRAVRDAEERIVDFAWEFANRAAGRLLRAPHEELVGQRLLDVMPAVRADLFPLYVRVVETGEPHDAELCCAVDGQSVWVRNMAVKVGDGVAVSSHDISIRKQAEHSLREADRRKDEFLAMLAHELRNPLSALQFALSVSQLPGTPEPRRAWARAVMERQLRQLGRMVDDLLDVSRITRGKITLKSEAIDLVPLVHQAVAASAPLMEAAKHELTLAVDEAPCWVFGDPARLEQVIVNLLTNAAKYTREGGRIRLSLAREGGDVVIRVRDTGVGIPAGMLPRVFELFEQAHPTLDRSRGGLGLGLTLVKRLVEMHGGTVSVASEGEGRGSEFVVRLTAVRAPDAAAEEPAAAPAARSRRVLVVDDNRDHALGLGLLLEQEGHVTALAHDGPTALEAARRFVPDVVLLDIGLPGMDGYEVARRLRRLDGAGQLKIFALSGYGQEEDQRRSREAGCDLHLVKPVDQGTLLAHIASEARR